MAKKVKVATTAIAEDAIPKEEALPKADDILYASRGATGRVVLVRAQPLGKGQLEVHDAGASPRTLDFPPGLFRRPDVSPDGKRCLTFASGPIPDVGAYELQLDGAPSPVRLWARGASFNVRSEPIVQVLYAGPDHVLLITSGKQALLRRAADVPEPVALLDKPEKVWSAVPLRGGRFAVLDTTGHATLIAIKGDALHAVHKLAKKTDTVKVRADRVFVQTAGEWAEITNLDEIHASL